MQTATELKLIELIELVTGVLTVGTFLWSDV